MMGRLYAIRSDVEHLHEHKYLESFDRTERLDLVQKEAIAEYIARNALAHIVRNPSFGPTSATPQPSRRFGSSTRLTGKDFWEAPPANPADALAGFDPKYISDGDLGA